MHDPVLNFLDFILPHSTQRSKKKEKKGRKKLITYLQTLTRTQNPRSSYFSFHSRTRAPYRPITTAAVSTTVETPPRTRRSRPSFFSPRNIRGTARLNSTGSTRVKRNWPRRRPFRGREASRFHAGRGYVVASWAARRILMRCPCCTRYT